MAAAPEINNSNYNTLNNHPCFAFLINICVDSKIILVHYRLNQVVVYVSQSRATNVSTDVVVVVVVVVRVVVVELLKWIVL